MFNRTWLRATRHRRLPRSELAGRDLAEARGPRDAEGLRGRLRARPGLHGLRRGAVGNRRKVQVHQLRSRQGIHCCKSQMHYIIPTDE